MRAFCCENRPKPVECVPSFSVYLLIGTGWDIHYPTLPDARVDEPAVTLSPTRSRDKSPPELMAVHVEQP